jgi:hypothetical protein
MIHTHTPNTKGATAGLEYTLAGWSPALIGRIAFTFTIY